MIVAKIRCDGAPLWALVEAGSAFALDGDRFGRWTKGAVLGPVGGLELLTPLETTNTVVSLFATWVNKKNVDGPAFAVKPRNTRLDPGKAVIYPKMCERLMLEAELGIVIGKPAHRVSREAAPGFIFGYTICNDLTALAMNRKNSGPVNTLAKSFDTFGPIGPWIATELSAEKAQMRAAVNGEVFVDVNLSQMLWSPAEIVSWVSQVMTLSPGDIISCGAPPGCDARDIRRGDRMKVTIAGVGDLENPVE